MGGEGDVYTFSQVSQHNNRRDCWVTIAGKVYNVTNFLDEHPGSAEMLLSATGKDATDHFEDVGHSPSARELMKKFYIGDIDASTIPKKTAYKLSKPRSESVEFIIKLLQFVLPLAVLGVAFGLRLYTKSN